jgi:hypothetical protein
VNTTTVRWYEDKSNLMILLNFMLETHMPASEIVRAVEKPWTYEEEFFEAKNLLEEELEEDRKRLG